MTDAASFRKAFTGFLGNEKFLNFVRTGVRQGKLRYWQEHLWQEFIMTHPDLDCSLDELAGYLRICPLHHEELRTRVETFDHAPSRPRFYAEKRAVLFPYAVVNEFGDSIEQFNKAPTEPIKIWYCPTCHAIRSVWKA